jgi:asparagine synthase (glutamine-hydrolysing)
MCGIVGQLRRNGSVARAELHTASCSVIHRGPDGDGLWLSPDSRVGLAHRRLAIIDVSEAASQPMLSRCGQLAIVFNGEIYNHAVIRKQLEREGRSFRTSSDTEVLLAAYDAWGDDCLSRLNGMFAFCIADLRRRQLFLARDRVGEKPLYYHATHHGFAFASELKSLFAFPETPRRIDADALNSYLAIGYVPREQSIVREVHKLLPGHALRVPIDEGPLTSWEYWRLPVSSTELAPRSAAAAAERLQPLLADAVKLQMVSSDVPIGVLLSGGLDSSLITALAADATSASVKTFSAIFPDHHRFDESSFARQVSAAFSTEHIELPIRAIDFTTLVQLAGHLDEPLADSSLIPTYMLSRAVREHVTVALGGDGGDELFGGYPHYSRLRGLQLSKHMIPAFGQRFLASFAERLPSGFRGRHYLMQMPGGAAEAIASVNVYFDEQARRQLLAPLAGQLQNSWHHPELMRAAMSPVVEPLVTMLRRADFSTYLPDDILVKVDRASMLASLEVRAPFLDHRICEFAFRLPDHLTATVRERKVVLRQLARRLLPPSFDTARKRGFSIPLKNWFKGEWKSAVSAALDTLPADVISPSSIAQLRRLEEAGLANSQRIFALIILSLWLEQHRLSF